MIGVGLPFKFRVFAPAALAFTMFTMSTEAAVFPTGPTPIPRLESSEGRHALIVDGKPYLVLGVQCHNSSAWPALLPKVWPVVQKIHANTLEVPIYWEQFEPEPGKFDTSVVDTLLRQARERGVRLILLWFATWKNGSSHYVPVWMKEQSSRFPRLLGRNGRPVDSPSPHANDTLEADTRAFAALMRHLKLADPQHTVIMVQVENEPGTWGSVRDFSPRAEALFKQPVPEELLKAKDASAIKRGSWAEVFGAYADEYFHAWHVASFIGKVAAAGKAENPLPMYVNAALRDPLTPGPASTYESGGPTDNVLWIWKAAAPSIDLLAPDIYQSDAARYRMVLELYGLANNALFIPETSRNPDQAHLFFAALGMGAIGWAPFGLDYTAYADSPLGAPQLKDEDLEHYALNYRMIEPMMREVARLNFEGKVKAVAETRGEVTQSLAFDHWSAIVSYGMNPPRFGAVARGNPKAIGRALVAQLSSNQFLVTGAFCRIDFKPRTNEEREFIRVEEGGFENASFVRTRIWNGDETDWGLNFSSAPQVLRVTLGKY